MAKRKFTNFVPRPKPRKCPRRHTKNLIKAPKDPSKNTIVNIVRGRHSPN